LGPSERTADDPWVGIVANAGSGMGTGRKRVSQLVDALRRQGLAARIAWNPQDRRAMVERAAADSQCRCLVAAGGDGTLSALINERPTVPVTMLASGTENLFARHFGMSDRPGCVAETIAEGRTMRLDLGRTPERRFALMAGLGFDADVVTRHHLARLGRAGKVTPTHRVAYVLPVLRSSWSYRFPPLRLAVTDPGPEEQLDGSMAFVFNLPSYALGLTIAPDARADDGWLDLVVFRDPGPFQALYYLWLVFRGTHLKHPGVEHRRVRRVRATAEAPVPVQLDGDPCGTVHPPGQREPWSAEVLPGTLEILVPETRARK
jgi:diacylglycerol kinase family enzyme